MCSTRFASLSIQHVRFFLFQGYSHMCSSADELVLAVQNMEASGTVVKAQEIEFNALEGSLSMMSKGVSLFRRCLKHGMLTNGCTVLNDVLDL